MRNLFFFLFTALLISWLRSTVFVDGSESEDLLWEDLAQSGGVEFKDENYEIVQFLHRDIESDNGNKKEVRFRRAIWTMKETSVIREETPIWVVHNAETIYKTNSNSISRVLKFYENSELLPSVIASVDESNRMYLMGYIGDGRIAALSNKTASSLLKEKPHLVDQHQWDNESEKFTVSDYHVIYTPKLPESGKIILPPLKLFEKPTSQYNETSYDRTKRSTAETVYPEVLTVLDYNDENITSHKLLGIQVNLMHCTYARTLDESLNPSLNVQTGYLIDKKIHIFHESDGLRFWKLIIYTINFWNSVNLRFSTLQNPKIQLRLTGIVVSVKRAALPFINDSISSEMLNIGVTWFSSQWVESFIPKATYDIILIQTNLDLCSQERDSDCENNGILGSASPGPVCHQGQHVMSGIIHDDRNYAGIRTAAHEIGHMLGARHDGSTSPDDCLAEKGYIMSWDYKYKDNSFEWSRCSQNSISQRLRSDIEDCLDNDSPISAQGDLLNKMLLPGQNISVDAQCEIRGYSSSCESPDICQMLLCTWYLFWCIETAPPYDGTPCPSGECRNGICVLEYQDQNETVNTQDIVNDPFP